MKKKTLVLNKLNLNKEIVAPLDGRAQSHVLGGDLVTNNNCNETLSLGKTCVPCSPPPNTQGTEASVCALCATALGVTTC